MNNKLQSVWFEKLQTRQNISVKDLYQFSKISLKRKRLRKKFEKNYVTYLSKEVYETYWGCLFAYPLISSFARIIDFPKIEPIDDDKLPKVNLVYLDYQYKKEKND